MQAAAAEDEEEDDDDDEAAEESELPPPASCSSCQRVSLERTYGEAAAMMRECAATSPPSPLLGRMRRSQNCGWLRRRSSTRASSEAACPSHFATVMLDGEEEEEDPPPALRFRPPTLPVLRRLPRELIAV